MENQKLLEQNVVDLEKAVEPYLDENYAEYMIEQGLGDRRDHFISLLDSFKEDYSYLGSYDSSQTDPDFLLRLKNSLLEYQLLLAATIEEFITNKFENILERPSLDVVLKLDAFNKKHFPTQDIVEGVIEKSKLAYNEVFEWLKENDSKFNEEWTEFNKNTYIIYHMVRRNEVEYGVLVHLLFGQINTVISQNRNFYECEVHFGDEKCVAYAYARIVTELNITYNLIDKVIFHS